MAERLIIDFLYDWVRTKKLREDVLHKEESGMGSGDGGTIPGFGLDDKQIADLRAFKLVEIATRMCEELGVDLKDLREAVYGPDSPGGAAGGAAYDEGRTHIRRIVPKVVPLSTATGVVLWGHGFKSAKGKVTVQFLQGDPKNPTHLEVGTVTAIECGVDVWQRVSVDVTLKQTGDWAVRARNDDDFEEDGVTEAWSIPVGTVHVV
jgi:hypothetical protein